MLGYWGREGDTPESVLREYLECIELTQPGDYVAIKAPAIDYSTDLYAQLAEAAAKRRTHLHVDAESPDTIDRAKRFAEQVLPTSPVALGWTLPGRWPRSIEDAAWAGELGLRVRIVKGHYADPRDDQDLRAGYRQVARTLARYRNPVAVAGHDLTLVEQVGTLLTDAGVPVEMELLYGLPWRNQLKLAAAHRWPVLLYVGYGHDVLPYALGQARRNPKVLWWIARDMLRSNG